MAAPQRGRFCRQELPAAQSPSTPAMPAAPTGYAVAARLGQAQNAALRHCYQYGGKDCVIRAWACDAKD
jgi:hypothetical protein